MLWDEHRLIEVCLTWGGRSCPLAQMVMEHGSAMGVFKDYVSVLNAASVVLPDGAQVTLLARLGRLFCPAVAEISEISVFLGKAKRVF